MMQRTLRLSPRALLSFRRIVLLAVLAGTALGGVLRDAAAQAPPFPPGSGPAGTNPMCQRLEAQLAAIDRGQTGDPRADQIRRLEETAARQQDELDRVVQQAKRLGCESSGLFAIFGGQSAQCGPVNRQIQQMRGALDQTMTSLDRLRGPGGSDRDGQRRSVLMALAQNNCGPQYAAAARTTPSGGFLNDLFGGAGAMPDGPPSSTFRTVCVRSCDGFFFPISFATVPSRFADDERTCKKLCPASEALLYTYRNPGEDMNNAVSTSGQPYAQMPNAFRYRQEFNPSCSCKAPGQSWADALKNTDDRSTVEQGDIVVTEERAKQMAQPRDAQGRPIRSPQNAGATTPPANAAADRQAPPPAGNAVPESPPAPNGDQPARPIRSVGPTYIPAR